jgi:5'-3' exonuclease
MGNPVKPFMQLLAVLPQQSNELLPKCLRKLVTNYNSSLYYMYPLEFEQDYINKHKYFMAVPKIPPLNMNLIKYIYNKYKNELTKLDLPRNELKDIYYF